MKVLDKDRASTSEPQKYLIVESAFLPIAFGPRRIAPALKELASKDSPQSLVSGRRIY